MVIQAKFNNVVEAKEVKSNYFGEDLSEISPLDNPLCLLKQNIS
jgi:hypothetical protein